MNTQIILITSAMLVFSTFAALVVWLFVKRRSKYGHRLGSAVVILLGRLTLLLGALFSLWMGLSSLIAVGALAMLILTMLTEIMPSTRLDERKL